MIFTACRAAVAVRALVEALSKRSRIVCVRRGRSRTVQACRIIENQRASLCVRAPPGVRCVVPACPAAHTDYTH